MSEPRHPIQPLVDDYGALRFKQNPIVRDLLDSGKLDLNAISVRVQNGRYSTDDYDQLLQLIGYSHSGFPGSDEIAEAAWAMHQRERPEADARADALRRTLDESRARWAEARDAMDTALGDGDG